VEGFCPHVYEAAQDRVRSDLRVQDGNPPPYTANRRNGPRPCSVCSSSPWGCCTSPGPAGPLAYLALAAIIAVGNMSVLRGKELAGDAILLLVAGHLRDPFVSPCRDYRAVKRPWYSRWYGLV